MASSARLSPALNVVVAAVQKAGRRLLRDFAEVEQLQVQQKAHGDFVSQADLRAEETLRTELSRARPNFAFLMEESGSSGQADWEWRWVVDPLDGTTNFLHGVPHFCISVGLEREGQIVAGVIYDPIKDEMFVAERGQGAYLNNRRIRVATRSHMADAVVSCGLPHFGRPAHPRFLLELTSVMAVSAGMRRFGAAALDLAYVAAGRSDIYWERDLNSWDIAAGMCIVREAGGTVSDCEGGSDPLSSLSVCVGNEGLHRELIGILKKANRPVTTQA